MKASRSPADSRRVATRGAGPGGKGPASIDQVSTSSRSAPPTRARTASSQGSGACREKPRSRPTSQPTAGSGSPAPNTSSRPSPSRTRTTLRGDEGESPQRPGRRKASACLQGQQPRGGGRPQPADDRSCGRPDRSGPWRVGLEGGRVAADMPGPGPPGPRVSIPPPPPPQRDAAAANPGAARPERGAPLWRPVGSFVRFGAARHPGRPEESVCVTRCSTRR